MEYTDDVLIERYMNLLIRANGSNGFVIDESINDNIDSPDVVIRAKSLLHTNNLISPNIHGTFIKTPFFNKVLEEGGWIAFCEERRLIAEQIQSTISTNRLSKQTMVITLILAGVASLGTLGQWLMPLKSTSNIEQKTSTQETTHSLYTPKCTTIDTMRANTSKKNDSLYIKN
jgi:hypothetical protein